MAIKQDTWKLVGTVAIPLVGGTIVGVLANKSTKKKYKKLHTPSFSPPGWVFPVAWTSLYTTMGIAKYKFDTTSTPEKLKRAGDLAYVAQLSFNFLWSFLFFKWNKRGLALIDAILLWISIMLNAFYFAKGNKIAGGLFIPYIMWASFAIVLNYATWELNK